MINSDEFVVEQWRSSMDRFMRDMWDRTPTGPGKRFLSPIDPTLGFSPENVEWQFPKIKARPKAKTKPVAAPIKPLVYRLTKAERKAIKAAEEAAAKDAKRKAIADEYARWEASNKAAQGRA